VVSYADISETKTLPEDLGGNARYLYAADINGINCYDLDTHQVVKRFNTSAWGNSGRKQMLYDSIRKEVILFHNSNPTNPFIINADSKSANFNGTLSKSFPIAGRHCDRVGFVYYKDLFFAPDNSSAIAMIDGESRNKLDVFLRISSPGHARFSILDGIGSVDTAIVKIKRNGVELLGKAPGSGSRDGLYNPIEGYYVIPERNAVRFFELNTFKQIASIGSNYSSLIDLDRNNNIIFGADRGGFYRIDGKNLVRIERDYVNNIIGENVNTHGAVRWSSYTGLFYVKVEKEETGTNTNPFLLGIDGTKDLSNCVIHKIPLSNPTGKKVVVNAQKDIELNQMRIC
jgi:hypothetical protein